MSKKLQLKIAEPCHENWDNMSPVEQGKFCGSCQKQVVDFSNMSDRQVAEFFKKPSTGSVCGRFMTDQLERPIDIPKKRIPWVRYFFQITLPAFLISMKASGQRKLQGKVLVNAKSDTTRKPINEYRTLGMVAPVDWQFTNKDTVPKPKEPVQTKKGEVGIEKIETAIAQNCTRMALGEVSFVQQKINGIVVDQEGEYIPFATIETGVKGQMLMADANGLFSMEAAWLTRKGIAVSAVGYEKLNVKLGEEEYKDDKLYLRLQANVVLPEVVVTGYSTQKKCSYMTGAVSYVVSDTFWVKQEIVENEKTKLPVEENKLKIYPNPVPARTTVNLSFKTMEEGYYELQIVNLSGQSILQKEVWLDGDARLLNIEIPMVTAGSYFLSLTDKKTKKKFAEKLIVQ